MIESVSNERIKLVRKLQSNRKARTQNRLFVAEGERWVNDALQARVVPHAIYCTQAFLDRGGFSAETGPSPTVVSEKVMATMSDVTTAPGILAVLPLPELPVPTSPTLLLILDQIRTPGNLGTMLRSAAAAGADAVVLTQGTVDAFNPKVVRGSMGAHLRLPIATRSWQQLSAEFKQLSFYVARGDGAALYSEVDWGQPSALIIGNEAQGASAEARALAQGVAIPMANATESLNAATACAVMLFEANRQRQLRLGQ